MTKFCKDCKYHYKRICTRYGVNNIVTGEPEYPTCTANRLIGECGSDGQHFEQKQLSVIKTITKFFKRKSDA